jgi:hypothetical protein
MLESAHRDILPAPSMPMLPARGYVSEHTQFIRKLIEDHPELPAQQREGRAIWWDKTPEDLADRRRMDERKVPQRPYVYGSE